MQQISEESAKYYSFGNFLQKKMLNSMYFTQNKVFYESAGKKLNARVQVIKREIYKFRINTFFALPQNACEKFK